MVLIDPEPELDSRYSDEHASPMTWEQARGELAAAEIFWLSTVRPDGRPHVTPLLAVWLDGALHFCTGADEQKARNLAENPQCILTTGRNYLNDGLDLVVEGEAVRVTDDSRLQLLADSYETKYGGDWHFDVRDGAFQHDAGTALVFEVSPTTAYGFQRNPYSHTRWRFSKS